MFVCVIVVGVCKVKCNKFKFLEASVEHSSMFCMRVCVSYIVE